MNVVEKEYDDHVDLGIMLPSCGNAVRAEVYKKCSEADYDEVCIYDDEGNAVRLPVDDVPGLIGFCQGVLARVSKRDYPQGEPEAVSLTAEMIDEMANGLLK